MQLSPHFSLAELTHSQTATRLGLDNMPPPDVIVSLQRTAQGLEQVRALLRCPVAVSSGYRSPQVNKAVGGKPGSQHQTGQAADITVPGYGTPRQVMWALAQQAAALDFDQMILEYPDGTGGGWVHISFVAPGKGRGQMLLIDANGARVYV